MSIDEKILFLLDRVSESAARISGGRQYLLANLKSFKLVFLFYNKLLNKKNFVNLI